MECDSAGYRLTLIIANYGKNETIFFKAFARHLQGIFKAFARRSHGHCAASSAPLRGISEFGII